MLERMTNLGPTQGGHSYAQENDLLNLPGNYRAGINMLSETEVVGSHLPSSVTTGHGSWA